jgi:hypothetical protein
MGMKWEMPVTTVPWLITRTREIRMGMESEMPAIIVVSSQTQIRVIGMEIARVIADLI